MTQTKWEPVLKKAKQIVNSYGSGVTLRQLFYRLVAAGEIPNSEGAYKTLSKRTAEGRRAGTFPQLIDNTRTIHRRLSFDDPEEAIDWLASTYRIDRQKGQPTTIYLGAEKATMQSLLEQWFGELGMPVILLRGYGSQTYLDDIRADVQRNGKAVLIYAGDLDPSGMDIVRDFNKRTHRCFSQVIQIAVTKAQIKKFTLTQQAGKPTDPRAAKFKKKYGSLFQIEVEAIDPNDLRKLYQDEIDKYMDKSTFEAQVKQEMVDKEALEAIAEGGFKWL